MMSRVRTALMGGTDPAAAAAAAERTEVGGGARGMSGVDTWMEPCGVVKT
jgi:hypothetical protein